ncbi:MAG TPA: efflux RND transporter periplasmic adaptor subunit, partial [Anaeromyxobacter sp.]|nr:efflux RND transporter periplasmic adaptor subunit [Anaeromyxobacter sp.]
RLFSPPRAVQSNDMKTRSRMWISVIVGLVVVVVLLVGIKAGQIVTMVRAGEKFAPPPTAVSSAKVEESEWAATRPAVATLVAVHGVTLGAELPGTVREVAFESGSSVKKGAVLVRLDTSTEEAQLGSAKAEAALAKLSLDRIRTLRASESGSQADLDAAEARAQQARSAVAALEATIAKKVIRAPFDGRIAIRQVELGQVVSPGTPIASLQSVTPIYADFWLPQQSISELKAGQRMTLRTDAFPDAKWEGQVTIVNPEVDPATRNVRVRATVPNADGRLRPGMFANVDVVSGAKRRTIVVPATAILYAPYGDSVFALEEKKDEKGGTSLVARQKFVRLGDRRGDYVAVVSGLSPGERIVSAGAFKLRNGMAVAVNDAQGPGAKLDPKPTDQ